MGFLTSRLRSALSLISHLAVGGDYSLISIMSRRKKISNPSQIFSNVFTWSGGLVVLCLLSFLGGSGRFILDFWSCQRTSQKREHGFGCGIGVMRIPRSGQGLGFLTSRWRSALSLLSHSAVVISLRKVFQMFSLGRRWRDYSLFSTSQHPEKNAEELACFGLC